MTMAPGVAVCKFVGTISVGLLTGLSFTLSTITVPTLLTLPSAQTAGNVFRALTDRATSQQTVLSGVASCAFSFAYILSPRALRHPYLLYTSWLVFTGRVVSDTLAPYLFSSGTTLTSSSSSSSDSTSAAAPSSPSGRVHNMHNMEASYEVLGSAGSVSGSVSDAHSDGADETNGAGAGAGAGGAGAGVNGEEVRASVEVFLKRQFVRTAMSGLAFAMAIVGLWGDGL